MTGWESPDDVHVRCQTCGQSLTGHAAALEHADDHHGPGLAPARGIAWGLLLVALGAIGAAVGWGLAELIRALL